MYGKQSVILITTVCEFGEDGGWVHTKTQSTFLDCGECYGWRGHLSLFRSASEPSAWNITPSALTSLWLGTMRYSTAGTGSESDCCVLLTKYAKRDIALADDQ